MVMSVGSQGCGNVGILGPQDEMQYDIGSIIKMMLCSSSLNPSGWVGPTRDPASIPSLGQCSCVNSRKLTILGLGPVRALGLSCS